MTIGILQKVTDAKTNTDNSQIKERINLAYHSSLVDGQGKVTEPSLENELKKEFNKTKLDEDWLDKTSVEGKWKITIDGISLEVPSGEEDNSKISIKVGTTNLKKISDLATLYGEMTDYTSVSDVQWQLFYDDETNIYLIASDYVPEYTLPSELVESTYSSYCRSFDTEKIMETTPYSNGVKSKTILENAQTNTYLKWVNSTLVANETNDNMKIVAYMMDTEKWKNFAGSANGAYAIGGPTLEMYVLSYNAKHNSKIGTYETIIDSNEDSANGNANSNGYKVKVGSDSWQEYEDRTLDLSSDNMWVKTNSDKANACWLASPSSGYGGNYVRIVYSTGSLSYGRKNNNYIGFRPLISIPKSSLK